MIFIRFSVKHAQQCWMYHPQNKKKGHPGVRSKRSPQFDGSEGYGIFNLLLPNRDMRSAFTE